MRKAFFVAMVAAVLASAAMAELQNIEVGGSLRIRGNWYSNEYNGFTAANKVVNNNPNNGLLPRPWGQLIAPINWAWDSNVGHDQAFVEERTRINFKADFTDEVSAFIELDSYDVWGEDFRSIWITGADNRGLTRDDVEVYQSYIEANNMFGQPLRLRIGRQELALGSQWLVGTNDTAAYFQGLSFDGIRFTYATDLFSVDAFWAKLAENSPIEADGDIDLYGVYGSYLGIEDITLDAYWLFVRDAVQVPETADAWFFANPAVWAFNRLEDWFGVDDYDVTNLHTVGLRGAGTVGAFDFEAEVAYQFGDADAVNFFNGSGAWAYPNDDDSFDAWGANAEVGYTFDMTYSPRVYLGAAYMDGQDDRTVDSFGEWLETTFWPFSEAPASVSFNRLFSNWEYSEFIENTDLSNVWIIRGGVSAMPTEDVEVLLALSYFETVDTNDVRANRFALFHPWVRPSFFPWRTENLDSELGWEVGLYVTYNYTEDLSFEAGYAHFFAGDGLTGADLWQANNGNFVIGNGTGAWPGPFGNWLGALHMANNGFVPGKDNDDADYLFFETKLKF